MGVVLALRCACPCGAAVTGDLILSLRYAATDRYEGGRWVNARLLGDADLRPAFRFHLDREREEPDEPLIREAYGEWELRRGPGAQRLRLGRFQVPFGIYNRSELYYVGLVIDPIVKYYPFEGPHLGRSEQGIGYLGASGAWQVEGALFGDDGGVEGFAPSGGEGSLRVQRFTGPLILGLNALRGHALHPDSGQRGTVRFFGLDVRYSRPTLILRGELLSGRVPGGSPRGFYLDALYHPVSLHRVTFVGRAEAAQGQPVTGRRYRRQTVGFKWDLGRGTTLAINQAFDSPRTRFGYHGTTIYVWHMRRL
jgi:hypothetical protein